MIHEPVKDTEVNFKADKKVLTQEQYEEVAQAVTYAVTVVRSQNSEELRAVWRTLSSLPREAVIGELLWRVEDYAYKADGSRAELSSLALTENADAIIDAVIKHDVTALKAAIGSDTLADLFASLLIIIAAFKDVAPINDIFTS